jgi:hypothetical protein
MEKRPGPRCASVPPWYTSCSWLVQNQGAQYDVARALSDCSRRGLPSPHALCPAGTAPPPPDAGVGEQRLRRMGSPRSPQDRAGCGTVACIGRQSAAHAAQEGMCAAHLLRCCLFGEPLAAFSPQGRRLARHTTTRCPLLWTTIAGLPLSTRPRLRQQWRAS